MIKDADVDGDDGINYEEFVRIILTRWFIFLASINFINFTSYYKFYEEAWKAISKYIWKD